MKIVGYPIKYQAVPAATFQLLLNCAFAQQVFKLESFLSSSVCCHDYTFQEQIKTNNQDNGIIYGCMREQYIASSYSYNYFKVQSQYCTVPTWLFEQAGLGVGEFTLRFLPYCTELKRANALV